MANEALPEGDGVALEWNNHNNDIGDWCPYSGDPVDQEDGARCPQWCMKSRWRKSNNADGEGHLD